MQDIVTGCPPDGGRSGTVIFTGPDITYGVAVDSTSVYFATVTNPGRTDSGRVQKVPLAGGQATVLASGLYGPGSIAVDGTNVYVSDGDGHAVFAVPLAGGSATMLAGNQDSPGPIAVANGFVYWVNSDSGALMRVPVSGGSPQQLYNGMTSYAAGLAVDAMNAYLTDSQNVLRVPVAGGAAVQFAMNQPLNPFGVALDATNVYWVVSGSHGRTTYEEGAIMKAPIAGGAPTMIAMAGGLASNIVVDAQFVYWLDTFSPSDTCPPSTGLWKAPIGGGAATQLAQADFPGSLAIDAANVYFTNLDNSGSTAAGTVVKVPK
jgi:sugar lactone lactonase YvrE